MPASLPARSGKVLRLAALCAAGAVPLLVSAGELTFDTAFGVQGEPPALHYRAVYQSKGAEHRVEVWRDGELRVKRRTDDDVETFAFREPGSAEFQISILDLRKRIHTRIDRTNLYRLGNFTDWFDLTHALRYPRGPYQLTRTPVAAGPQKPIDRCLWYELRQERRVTRICWSARDRIPLVIQAGGGEIVWRVTDVDRARIPPEVFQIHDQGFVRNDASADIEGD